jgi:tryptophan synthase alpha chain
MGRIKEKFSELKKRNEKAFIPFITAGDPDLETTAQLILELERAGAALVELGVPFSDPIADGPVIQRSSARALKKGCALEDILSMVGHVRRHTAIPIVLFSYYNPLLQFGLARLATEAHKIGIDGILTTDLTPEEAGRFLAEMKKADLETIFLVAPTSTPQRVKLITEVSSGFVYLVSRTGVTGARAALPDGMLPIINQIRKHTGLPIAVGFGISKPEQVKEVWQYAEGAVVGSAIVAKIEEYGSDKDLVKRIGKFAGWLRGK